MDYKLQKFSSDYLSSLTSLLDDSFSIQNKNKESLILWKYFDKYLNNKTVTYIALDKNNNVVSQYTNLPISISVSDKTFKATVCTDMCTDINHRGKGLISALSAKVYEEIRKNNYDFSIGFSNDEGVKVDKNSASYEYNLVGRFVRYFKFVVTRKKVKYELKKTSNFDREFYSQNSQYLKIKKNHEYLNWRYLKKPSSEYDIYSINENDLVLGYVVLRFINQKCYIYDIVSLSDEKSHMITILRSIENKALDHKTRIIIYNVLDNNYWKSLFNRYKYFKKIRNNVNYYLTIKFHNKNLPQDFLLNKENWLLMNGDIL